MQHIISRSLSVLGREAAKIVLPSDCVVCARPLPWSERVGSCCNQCWRGLPAIRVSKCRVCASTWNGSEAREPYTCLACHERRWPLTWIDSWGHYRDGLESVLHAFKFGRHDFLARPLGLLLMDLLAERQDPYFDWIVPVPMHPKKLRRRGYNQSELLARSLSAASGIPMLRILRKHRDNSTQSRLPKAERAANVRNVFTTGTDRRARRQLDEARVLLVDDICTTGETLAAASRVLVEAGAGAVAAVTVARA